MLGIRPLATSCDQGSSDCGSKLLPLPGSPASTHALQNLSVSELVPIPLSAGLRFLPYPPGPEGGSRVGTRAPALGWGWGGHFSSLGLGKELHTQRPGGERASPPPRTLPGLCREVPGVGSCVDAPPRPAWRALRDPSRPVHFSGPQFPSVNPKPWTRKTPGSVLGPGPSALLSEAGMGCPALSFGVRMGREKGNKTSFLGPRLRVPAMQLLGNQTGAVRTHYWTARS